MESLSEQFLAFAATVAAGLAAGFFYNYYCELRRAFKFRKRATILGDIVFWLVTTAVIFLALLRGNWGEVRLYVFVGLFLGAFFYYWLLSAPVSRFLRFKFQVVKKTWALLVRCMRLTCRAVLFPFRLVILAISFPLGFLGTLLNKASRKSKTAWYNVAGKRVERGLVRARAGLRRLLCWRKGKKGE